MEETGLEDNLQEDEGVSKQKDVLSSVLAELHPALIRP